MQDIQTMTDAELAAARAGLPAYRNDMTAGQEADTERLYAEQLRRYKESVAAYNTEAEQATGLHHGDRVSYGALGFGGLTMDTHYGKVIYDRNGRLAIRTSHADGSGRKTFPIHTGWKKEG